jgi:serine phosphatase RsbU (regulator of sigma subunit)
MAQLRGLLRGIAYDSSDGPAGVLARLDTAIDGLDLGALATVLVGRLERPADGTAATRLRWASAGHLPPVVVGRDGRVQVLDGGPPGLLLGVDPSAVRAESEVVLEHGSTVLLYTDGLVERRDQVFDEGVARLADALAELRDRPLEEVSDALLDRLLPDGGEDDVALVAVRLATSERPRLRVVGRPA